MKGKNASKPLVNKVFQCSVTWKIRHGSGFENKDEKAYLEKEAEKEIPYERIGRILDNQIYSSLDLKNSSSSERRISIP